MNHQRSGQLYDLNCASIIMVPFLAKVGSPAGGSGEKYTMNERRNNHRHFLQLEQKNTARAVVECGLAEFVPRFEAQSSLPNNELQTNPLSVLASTSTLFGYGTSGCHRYVNPASMILTS